MEILHLNLEEASEDYRRVEAAIRFLESNYQRQPGLKEVAESVHLSEYHFQKLFTRWAGISPKRFLQYLTKEHAKALLERSSSLLEASYSAGLSGPGRLHDLFVQYEAVTPGEYKSRGAGLEILYGFHPSPFGDSLLAITERGICGLSFVQDNDRQGTLADLRRRWSHAVLRESPAETGTAAYQAFSSLAGEASLPIHLYLQGTSFQLKVWEALMAIPPGSVVTYRDLAVHVGLPKAARAVGRAVGDNPVSVLIPCHRVIRKDGEMGGYRWGVPRKRALLALESSRAAAA